MPLDVVHCTFQSNIQTLRINPTSRYAVCHFTMDKMTRRECFWLMWSNESPMMQTEALLVGAELECECQTSPLHPFYSSSPLNVKIFTG